MIFSEARGGAAGGQAGECRLGEEALPALPAPMLQRYSDSSFQVRHRQSSNARPFRANYGFAWMNNR
jgi:hypothetical protein